MSSAQNGLRMLTSRNWKNSISKMKKTWSPIQVSSILVEEIVQKALNDKRCKMSDVLSFKTQCKQLLLKLTTTSLLLNDKSPAAFKIVKYLRCLDPKEIEKQSVDKSSHRTASRKCCCPENLFILFHGQVRVERGFSINKCLTRTSRRLYWLQNDGSRITSEVGELENFIIKDLLQSCKSSHKNTKYTWVRREP